MKFSRLENYDDLLKYSSTQDGLISIQKNIIMFIEYCKQRKLSYNTIHGYVTGLRMDLLSGVFGKLIANRQLDPKEEMSKVLELIQNTKRAFIEEEMKKGNSSLMH